MHCNTKTIILLIVIFFFGMYFMNFNENFTNNENESKKNCSKLALDDGIYNYVVNPINRRI
jgi:hypothetical protein